LTNISIIIPALNEAEAIGETLDAAARVKGGVEVIVVDGGSADGTAEVARAHGARVVTSVRGRGAQMHAGALAARGGVLFPPGIFLDREPFSYGRPSERKLRKELARLRAGR